MQLIVKQAIKFVLVGILNTGIDFGVSNLIMLILGVYAGLGFVLAKGIGFTVAVINSYFLNKFWSFRGQGGGGAGKEFTQFFVVSLIGLGINVGVASLVVNIIGPQFGIGVRLWANVGLICATGASMIWNFIGYKFIVFKNAKSGSLPKI